MLASITVDPSNISRREAIRLGVVATGAVVAGSLIHSPAFAAEPASPVFSLPPLPYAPDALEPHIDAQTMTIHHDKHHAAYVAKLNEAIGKHPELSGKTIESLVAAKDLPEDIATAVRNHGGGHHTHSLFWTSMKNGGGGSPKDELAGVIDKAFGSYDQFKETLTKTALGVFGSGWAWLCAKGDELVVTGMPNQDSPLREGLVPMVGVDVWEHAYYLKYQNKRADYVKAWFEVVDWEEIAKRWAKRGESKAQD
jgi:Fe-Mn family superoxide dismutase